MVLAILPEIGLVVWAVIILVMDLVCGSEGRDGWAGRPRLVWL